MLVLTVDRTRGGSHADRIVFFVAHGPAVVLRLVECEAGRRADFEVTTGEGVVKRWWPERSSPAPIPGVPGGLIVLPRVTDRWVSVGLGCPHDVLIRRGEILLRESAAAK